jgi:hypothetical protein
MLHSHGFLHYVAHDSDSTLEVEALTRTNVQFQGEGILLFLAVDRQICALGQVLAD